MTLAGLVSHLRWVEYFWFQVMLLGEEDHGPGPRRIPSKRAVSGRPVTLRWILFHLADGVTGT